jgi:hypothetical protein
MKSLLIEINYLHLNDGNSSYKNTGLKENGQPVFTPKLTDKWNE